MTVLMGQISRKTTEFGKIKDNISTTMKNLHLPEQLQLKIIDYINNSANNLNFRTDFEKFQALVPPSLQQRVNAFLFKHISKNPIFGNDKHVTLFVLQKLDVDFRLPESNIIEEGDTDEILYFLSTGYCSVS